MVAETEAGDERLCEHCKGKGRALRHDVAGIEQFMDTCMFCRGSGKEKDNWWKYTPEEAANAR